jgi:NADH-quinone oxidoreductase subunit E
MVERSADSSELFWSFAWWLAALVAGVLVFILTSFLIADDPAAGLVFGGVAFVVVGALMVAFGPGPAASRPGTAESAPHSHASTQHYTAPAAERVTPAEPVTETVSETYVPEAVPSAIPTPAEPLVSAPGPNGAAAPSPAAELAAAPGAAVNAPISERVRDAARAAGEAARAALGDLAPEQVQPAGAVRPPSLDGPIGGAGDDLKKISGIGPKIEARLNRIGIFHFHQIASWGPAEIAWVDANLEDYQGRASRDDWVGQAQGLAGGEIAGPTDRGEV